jgi:hypothetical protein
MKIYSTQNSESQVPEAASDEGLLAGGDSTESSGDTGHHMQGKYTSHIGFVRELSHDNPLIHKWINAFKIESPLKGPTRSPPHHGN